MTVASWNVLADSYVGGHQTYLNASDHYALHWSHRSALINDVISCTYADILCLQEIDHYTDFYEPYLLSIGYVVVYVQRPSRNDGCLIAFRPDIYELVNMEQVQFNDLSFRNEKCVTNMYDVYEKNNVGVMVKLKCKTADEFNNRVFCVACTHLYWSPQKEFIKLAQAAYLMQKLEVFSRIDSRNNHYPVIIGGDFNSFPESPVIKLVTQGFRPPTVTSPVQPATPQLVAASTPPQDINSVKFLCDHSLSKLAKWMRMLGFNVALEKDQFTVNTKNEYKEAVTKLFNRAKEENRILLTSSKTLRARVNCPQSMYIKTGTDLVPSLVDIFTQCNLKLDASKFLTVCGKCGGEIDIIDDQVRAELISKKVFVPEDKTVFHCVSCHQPYWWSESETSSPGRAMKTAYSLYKQITTIMNDPNYSNRPQGVDEGVGDEISPEESKEIRDIWLQEKLGKAVDTVESCTELDTEEECVPARDDSTVVLGVTINGEELTQLFHKRNEKVATLQQKKLTEAQPAEGEEVAITSNDKSQLPYYFASSSAVVHGEPPFTNAVGEFRGTLDYIFVSNPQDHWTVHDSYLFGPSIASITSLPTAEFPSDHLLVLATLSLN